MLLSIEGERLKLLRVARTRCVLVCLLYCTQRPVGGTGKKIGGESSLSTNTLMGRGRVDICVQNSDNSYGLLADVAWALFGATRPLSDSMHVYLKSLWFCNHLHNFL